MCIGATECHALCAEAYAAIDAEYPESEYPELNRSARGITYDLTRVEVEEWADDVHRDPWLEAHMECFYEEWDALCGGPPHDGIHGFGRLCRAAEERWHAAHPEYKAAERERLASNAGTLF